MEEYLAEAGVAVVFSWMLIDRVITPLLKSRNGDGAASLTDRVHALETQCEGMKVDLEWIKSGVSRIQDNLTAVRDKLHVQHPVDNDL